MDQFGFNLMSIQFIRHRSLRHTRYNQVLNSNAETSFSFFPPHLRCIMMNVSLQKAFSSRRALRASACGFPGSSTDTRRVWQLRCLTHSQLHLVVWLHLNLGRRRRTSTDVRQDAVASSNCREIKREDFKLWNRVIRHSDHVALRANNDTGTTSIVPRCWCRISVRWNWRKKRKMKQTAAGTAKRNLNQILS